MIVSDVIIIPLLTNIFRLLNKLGKLIHYKGMSRLIRYSKWKSKLSHLGKKVVFYRGVVIHNSMNVSIGSGTAIAEYVHMWGGGGIKIGENVLIASHVIISSVSHNPMADLYKESSIKKEICIEDNVWLGAGSIILPGVRIGRNAIIGAGAVVTKDVNPSDIVVGIPARILMKK